MNWSLFQRRTLIILVLILAAACEPPSTDDRLADTVESRSNAAEEIDAAEPRPGEAVLADAVGPSGPFTGEVKPVLYVADVEASAPFFRDVLGFEFLGYSELDGAPYYAEMAAGRLKFGLHNALDPEHEEWIGHQRIYFRVADVVAHRAAVLAGGGEPGELLERDWMDMFIVRDPDGHEIVFAETDAARHSIDPW